MAQLFSVYFAKSKTGKRTLIMTDTMKKCQNYVKAREVQVRGFHVIEPAEEGQKNYKKNKPLNNAWISRDGTYNHKN